MLDDPSTDLGMPKKVRYEGGVGRVSHSNPKASRATQPTIFNRSNERSALDIAATGVDDVTSSQKMAVEASSVRRTYTCDAALVYDVITDILWHNHWNATGHIVRSM